MATKDLRDTVKEMLVKAVFNTMGKPELADSAWRMVKEGIQGREVQAAIPAQERGPGTAPKPGE